MLGANLIAQEVKFDVAGGEAGGSGGVGEKVILSFVISACAFEFGAFLAVDGKVTVSVAISELKQKS